MTEKEPKLVGERDSAREAAKKAWEKVAEMEARGKFGKQNINEQLVSRMRMKPEKFSGSGNDTDFQAFLDQFEACLRMNNWSEDEKRNQLIMSMKDRARVVMSQLSSSDKDTYKGMVKALSKKLGMRQVPEAAKATLKARRRKVGETLLDLSIDIKCLCGEAYPTLNSDSMEQACIDHFTDALGALLAKDVIRSKPTTLDKALSEALELEALELRATRMRERVVNEVLACEEEGDPNQELHLPSWAPGLSTMIASAKAKATAEAVANAIPSSSFQGNNSTPPVQTT